MADRGAPTSSAAPAARILVVDDEPALVKALELNLRARKYEVVTARTGLAAIEAASTVHVDAVILDLGLPDLDGNEVIDGLRGWSEMPILVLSARHRSDDKVEALDAGADDYVTKPFEMSELLARLRAMLRRSRPADQSPVVEAGPVTIDLGRALVTVGGQQVKLTPTEWNILELLARSPDSLVTQATILRQVWGQGYEDQTHYVRVYLGTLRRKLGEGGERIVTEPGLGYRLLTD